jgi:thiamine transport system permease protein
MRLLPRITTVVIGLTLVLASLGLYLHPGQGAPWLSYFDSWLYNILEFSIMQAALSAALSVLVAIPFALFFAHSAFNGQWLLKGLLNLFFIMPVLTVVLGVVSAFSDLTDVFSLKGIVIAHMYLNVPYAIRLLWERLGQVSQAQLNVASTLGFTPWHTFRWIQLPVVIDSIKPIFVLIFLLCFSSFTIVLTMGGGPANTNLEVAIYQALKFDFDPTAGAIYACFHGGIAFFFMWFLGKRQSFSLEISQMEKRQMRWPGVFQALAIAALLVTLAYPLLSLVLKAISVPFTGSDRLFEAVATSLVLAVGSGILAVCLALMRSLDRTQSRATRFIDFGLLVLPIMVISTGLFLLALKLGIAFKITSILIIWLNGLLAMPLILGPMQSRIRSNRVHYNRLFMTLGFTEYQQFRWVYLPAVVPVLPWSIMLAMVLSVGDLGVAALVGSAQFVTLPILIYQAMGSYQMVLASQLTVILLVICCSLLVVAEWLGDRNQHVRS